jgi:uncharacterized membrane protein
MTWRGSADIKDKIFGALVYLLPLFYAYPYGKFLFAQFPFLQLIQIPLIPIAIIYDFLGSIIGGFAGLVIFIVLFAAVVRNARLSHFIRFNTMQSILIDILLSLIGLIVGFLSNGLGSGLVIETFSNLIFLGTLTACVYGIIQSLSGKYADIPGISEAAYSQVPW